MMSVKPGQGNLIVMITTALNFMYDELLICCAPPFCHLQHFLESLMDIFANFLPSSLVPYRLNFLFVVILSQTLRKLVCLGYRIQTANRFHIILNNVQWKE